LPPRLSSSVAADLAESGSSSRSSPLAVRAYLGMRKNVVVEVSVAGRAC
jgi:hypothetical protein